MILSYREALYKAMDEALRSNPRAVIFGQGVADHKGIFGSTTGLAEKYGPGRVCDMPLAEEMMTGVAVGAALKGLYPIQTHIRADFVLLAMNQIVNLIAKYQYMFGGRFKLPMLIRLVVGRSWGQGSQHSQSLQSLFAHVPGLRVIMPSCSQTILQDYEHAVSTFKGPVISFEHRLMYDLEFSVSENPEKRRPFASAKMRSGRDVTIAATSIMVLEALRAAEYLEKEAGIQAEVIDIHSVSHPDGELIYRSVQKTGKLIVADTSWTAYGVCAEISRLIAGKDPAVLKRPVVSIGMAPCTCPTAKSLEDLFYPNLKTLTDSIAVLVTGKTKHGIRLPGESSMADVYKRFKGPF